MRALLMIVTMAMFAAPADAADVKKCKDAKTGHFVTAKHAEKHPSTTYCMTTKK